MGGFSSTASSLDLTKHKKGSVINDPAVGCIDASGNHFFSANLLSLFRVGSWTKAPPGVGGNYLLWPYPVFEMEVSLGPVNFIVPENLPLPRL